MLDFTPSFGRLENPDERDVLFPVSAVLPDHNPFITEKYWWDNGWWGNQRETTECVAYSWMHWVEDGPVVQDGISDTRAKPIFKTTDFYHACQDRDPWPGRNYAGTSVRTGAQVLQRGRYHKEYRWANNSEEIAQTLLNLGPVVVGTRWTLDMAKPKPNGIIRPTGSGLGGHAYMLNGVDYTKKMFRIKNSWGREWGKNGYAFISFEDFEGLLANGGEACVAFENKMVETPSLVNLSTPTSA